MNIAMLGATSQIAKDLIYSLIATDRTKYSLALFARSPEKIIHQLKSIGISDGYSVYHFNEFKKRQNFDLIINFVGVGNPAQAAAMGSSIFDITLEFDGLVLEYLYGHPDCRYIFLSSGAAYGVNFEKPVDEESSAVIPLNNFQPQDWYSLAKLHAECRHRAHQNLPIVDIRIFNYFSHTQDMSSRFLITDIIRSIQSGDILRTSSENIVRDFLHPSDFFRLFEALISSPPTNLAVDSYTRAPIDKLSLLSEMQSNFGLKYEEQTSGVVLNATGAKPFYFSKSRVAKKFGYEPIYTSLEGIIKEAEKILQSNLPD